MLNKIAIINCKAKKQNYTCLAEKMYDVSFQFRHQVDFLKEYYGNYLILSSKYGIVSPDTIIDPYELTLSKGARLKNVPKLEGIKLQNWILQVKSQLQSLSTQYDQIDLHISNAYLGYARHLCKKYPIVDEGNATRVSRGLNFHTQGWVVNKESLSLLYKTDKGQWRTKRKK